MQPNLSTLDKISKLLDVNIKDLLVDNKEGMRTKKSWEKGLSQYQQIGNALPVLLAYHISEHVKNLINGI